MLFSDVFLVLLPSWPNPKPKFNTFPGLTRTTPFFGSFFVQAATTVVIGLPFPFLPNGSCKASAPTISDANFGRMATASVLPMNWRGWLNLQTVRPRNSAPTIFLLYSAPNSLRPHLTTAPECAIIGIAHGLDCVCYNYSSTNEPGRENTWRKY